MFSSILHRATGAGSVAGLIMVIAWLVCLALGPQAYTGFVTFGASPLGMIIWVLLSLAGFVHLAGGIRHFIWDLGGSFQPKAADALVVWTTVLGVVLTVAFWAALILCHKVSL